MILIQFILVIILGYGIYRKKSVNTQKVSVAPQNSENLIHSKNTKLKYYTEPRASTIITDKVSWLPFISEYSINRDSLNELKNYKITRQPSTYRIITMGDSFTYGLYVNTYDNWTEIIERRLNKELICSNYQKIEVINLGVPGYDIEYAVERFKIRGIKYNPNLIIWFLKDDDVNMINEFFIPKLQEYNKKNSINTNSQDYHFNGDNSYPIHSKLGAKLIEEIGKVRFIEYQKRILYKFNDLNKKNGVIIMTFPFTNGEYQEILRDFVDSGTYYYFNKLTNIYKIGGLSYFDGHPNKEGHQIIAEDVYDYIVDNEIIPCD